jgi:hypothetical protein
LPAMRAVSAGSHPHQLGNYQFSRFQSLEWVCGGHTVVTFPFLWWLDMSDIFSCADLPSTHVLSWSSDLDFSPLLEKLSFCCCHWVIKVLYILRASLFSRPVGCLFKIPSAMSFSEKKF